MIAINSHSYSPCIISREFAKITHIIRQSGIFFWSTFPSRTCSRTCKKCSSSVDGKIRCVESSDAYKTCVRTAPGWASQSSPFSSHSGSSYPRPHQKNPILRSSSARIEPFLPTGAILSKYKSPLGTQSLLRVGATGWCEASRNGTVTTPIPCSYMILLCYLLFTIMISSSKDIVFAAVVIVVCCSTRGLGVSVWMWMILTGPPFARATWPSSPVANVPTLRYVSDHTPIDILKVDN